MPTSRSRSHRQGKLLTLTSAEALSTGGRLRGRHARAGARGDGLPGAELRYAEQTWAEGLVRFLTNPVVSSLLMTLGLLGSSSRSARPASPCPARSASCRSASSSGATGSCSSPAGRNCCSCSSACCSSASRCSSFPASPWPAWPASCSSSSGWHDHRRGRGHDAGDRDGARPRGVLDSRGAGRGVRAVRVLPVLPFGRRLVLESGMARRPRVRVVAGERPGVARAHRVALSPLRPAGTADIDGERVDVVSDGGFIEAGAPIEVSRVDGYRIVVRRRSSSQESST
jgi:membrane-bound serine protease (ClpP class)